MKSQGRLSDPWLTWVLTMYRLPLFGGHPPRSGLFPPLQVGAFAAGAQLALFGGHPPRSGLFSPRIPKPRLFSRGFGLP